ncbi:MAG: AAA family ATPase, partial [Planctomycetota bacterium]
KLEVGGVDRGVLEAILGERRAGKPPTLTAASDAATLAELFKAVDAVFLPKAVASWIARLVEATHPKVAGAPERVKTYVRHGASPRGAIAIGEAARAHALLAGKPNVGFDDVRAVAVPALAHRLVLDYRARLDGVGGSELVRAVLGAVPEVDEGA